VHSGLPG
jgi:hypothetical protein